MKIEEANGELIVRIPTSVGDENVQNLLDYIQYLEGRNESGVDKNEVEDLAKEVNQLMWKRFQQDRAEK